jgi:hypothetical protein
MGPPCRRSSCWRTGNVIRTFRWGAVARPLPFSKVCSRREPRSHTASRGGVSRTGIIPGASPVVRPTVGASPKNSLDCRAALRGGWIARERAAGTGGASALPLPDLSKGASMGKTKVVSGWMPGKDLVICERIGCATLRLPIDNCRTNSPCCYMSRRAAYEQAEREREGKAGRPS